MIPSRHSRLILISAQNFLFPLLIVEFIYTIEFGPFRTAICLFCSDSIETIRLIVSFREESGIRAIYLSRFYLHRVFTQTNAIFTQILMRQSFKLKSFRSKLLIKSSDQKKKRRACYFDQKPKGIREVDI